MSLSREQSYKFIYLLFICGLINVGNCLQTFRSVASFQQQADQETCHSQENKVISLFTYYYYLFIIYLWLN